MSHKTTNKEQEINIVKLYQSGLSMKSIENKTKIGRQVIERVLHDWNIPSRSSGGVRPYNVDSSVFNDLHNESSSYWLGFLFAELSIERTNITISLSAKDRLQLERWANFIKCEKPIKDFEYRGYKIVRLDVSDRILSDRIRDLGIEPFRKRGVELLSKIPKNSLNHFIRGWFDGDGCAYTFPQLCFVGREKFLMEIQKIFIENAYANEVTLKSRNESKDFCNLFYKGVNRCNEISKYMYRDATIWMERKRERINNWNPPKYKRSTKYW